MVMANQWHSVNKQHLSQATWVACWKANGSRNSRIEETIGEQTFYTCYNAQVCSGLCVQLGNKGPGCESVLPGFKAEGGLSLAHEWTVGFGCCFVVVALGNKQETPLLKNHQSHCSSYQAERAGEPLYMWVCLPLGLTLLLLRCSLGSSRSSGRLRLRVGWIHTTLLSHEGGPTGGSLSSWSSERSSSVSTAQRTVRSMKSIQLFTSVCGMDVNLWSEVQLWYSRTSGGNYTSLRQKPARLDLRRVSCLVRDILVQTHFRVASFRRCFF